MSFTSLKSQYSDRPLVFISHAHQDAKHVRKIKDWLEATGCICWAFWEKCTDRYREQIDAAIIECNIFLLIGSKSSFRSNEVKREVVAADLKHKPLVYYKLDGASHLDYPGFLTILGNKQFIQATDQSVPEQLKDLAKAIYEAWGKDQATGSIADINQRISELYKQEIHKLNLWRDRLWTLKIDSKGRTKRNLSNSDRESLRSYAQDLKLYLSIEDEEISCKPKKGEFYQELRSIIASRKIDKRVLSQVEKRRLKCFISKVTAVQTLEKLLKQNDYLAKLSLSQQASLETAHWFVESVVNLKSKSNGNCGLDPIKGEDSNGSPSNEETVKQNDASMDSTLLQRASAIRPIAETDKQKEDSYSDNPSKGVSHSQDTSDESADVVQPINCTDNTQNDSADEAGSDQGSSHESTNHSPSYIYSLEDLPSSILRPVSVLVHEIADSHVDFTNLMTSSETVKLQTAALFNIHKDHANKLIMLATLSDERGVDYQILVSTNYLSIAGQRSRVLPYHFPLVIEKPARRIVMTTHERLGTIVFSYSPRFGVVEKCSQISPTKSLFTKEMSRLFKWLLILLESNCSSFSDATGLTSADLSYVSEAIQSRNFQELDETSARSRRSRKACANIDQLSTKQSNKPLTVEIKGSSDLRRISAARAVSQSTQNAYITKLSETDVDGNLFRDFNRFSKPSRLQFGKKIADDPTYQKMLTSHRLKGLQGFKPLLYYSAGSFRVKRGIILFDKGISLLTFFSEPRLFLFGIEELGRFYSLTVQNNGLKIDFNSLSFSVSNGHNSSRSEYLFEHLEGINDVDFFAASLQSLIEQLNEYRLTCSRLRDSICAEARELLYFKSVDLRSGISVFDLPASAGASSLPLDILELLLFAKLDVPHVSDVLLSIKSEGSGFTSLILIALDGVSMAFSNGKSAKGKRYNWSSIYSLTYLPHCSSGNSELVVNNGCNSFAVQWAHRNASQHLFKELASFVLSLAKRLAVIQE